MITFYTVIICVKKRAEQIYCSWDRFSKSRVKGMMHMKPLFEGVATALVTPFCNNEIDYTAMGEIIDFQISEGANAIVVCGTTGEVSTLSKEERQKLIVFTVEKCAGRIPVIAGTGGNNTKTAAEMSVYARNAGADGILSVAPYYNKGTKDGIIRHYREIAEKCRIPVMVYNVPSRTGVNLTAEIYKELSQIPYITSIKEAGGNAASWLLTIKKCGDKLAMYSGNDSDTLQMMALGAKGVVSVASNIAAKRLSDMCRAELLGDRFGARALFLESADLFDVLFKEVNPVPIKYAMSRMGFCRNELRLPLTSASPETEKAVDKVLCELGFI